MFLERNILEVVMFGISIGILFYLVLLMVL